MLFDQKFAMNFSEYNPWWEQKIDEENRFLEVYEEYTPETFETEEILMSFYGAINVLE
jgi:hypothetical protein